MLRWNHDWGTNTEHWEKLIEMGRQVPAGYHDRPDILPVASFYWTAFCDLETERSVGMAVGPIPRSRAREYAIEHGITDADAFIEFWIVIARLDNEAGKVRRAKEPEEEMADKVSVKDVSGVKTMMRNINNKRTGRQK